jgi:hypothetical protein
LDSLDPAFAPGVSHIEPGGLSFRDALNIIHNLQGNVVAGDVVEFNPQRDTVDGMTAMVAAKLVRELSAKISKWKFLRPSGQEFQILSFLDAPCNFSASSISQISSSFGFKRRIWKDLNITAFRPF